MSPRLRCGGMLVSNVIVCLQASGSSRSLVRATKSKPAAFDVDDPLAEPIAAFIACDEEGGCTPGGNVPTEDHVPPVIAGPQRRGKRLGSSLEVYCRQDVFLANFALALLYMTVLSLGYLMTSYLKWCGLTEAEVGM